jgi:hypothetical protein
VTALTGFQSAIARSTAGMCWVATSALDTNDSGNNTIMPMFWADSVSLAAIPMQAHTHDIA